MAMNKSHVPAAQKGVLGMLIDDHREAQKLFKDFKSAKEDSRKDEIVRHACTALTAHTRIEEEHFYPFLRDADPEAFGSLLDEAKVEHASAKDLIAQLQAMQPGDELYDAHFTVLGEYTTDHGKMVEEARKLAQEKGYTPPDGPSVMQKGEATALKALSGGAFDASYVNRIGVAAHESTIKQFEAAAGDVKDPDIKAMIQKTLPKLRDHLQMARALDAKQEKQ